MLIFFFFLRVELALKFRLLEAIYNQNLVHMFYIFQKQNLFVLLSENMIFFRNFPSQLYWGGLMNLNFLIVEV